jgi:serine/threonine-protein kinase
MGEGAPRPNPSASSGTTPKDVPDPLVGRVVGGKFSIESELGQGAMGTVYRARQVTLDKTVAIKVLNRDLATDANFADRFSREAKAASRLDHPNSIRVFDFGREPDGLLYLAMEYIQGRDLQAVLSEGAPLLPRAIVEILSQVLAALAVAHDMGVLHRDLKPENIMLVRGVGDDGQPVDIVKVCDFGIAKILDAPSPHASTEVPQKLTTVGLVIGTPAYMSPEQARGQAVDGRSDLYSVGVLLYEMLAGQVPFDGNNPLDVVLKHIGEAPVPPSARASVVDARLEAICLRAMAKQPGERFRDAREMRLALREAVGVALPSTRSLPGAPEALVAEPRRASGDAEPGTPASTKPTLGGVTPLVSASSARRSSTWRVAAALILGSGVAGFLILRWQARRHAPTAPAAAEVRELGSGPTNSIPAALSVPAPQSVLELEAAPVASVIAPPAPDVHPAPHEAKGRRAKVEAAKVEAAAMAHAATAPAQPAANEVASPFAQSPSIPTAAAATVPAAAAPVTAALPPVPPPPAPPPAPTAAAHATDPASARVDLGEATNTVGATSSSFTRAVSEASAQVTSCYRSAISRTGGTLAGRAQLHVETDGAGVITNALLSGLPDATVARCVASAVRGRRVANVDTGSASADVPMVFRTH